MQAFFCHRTESGLFLFLFFSTESQKTYLCTSDKAGLFSNKKSDSYKYWTCTELSEAFIFLIENIYLQFDGMVYQQIVGIPMGRNCAPLIADLLAVFRRDVLWYGDVRPGLPPGLRPSVRLSVRPVSVRPFSAFFSYML